MNTENIPLLPGFKQVCVMQGTLAPDPIEDFVTFFQKELGVRVQYLETILTNPDPDSPKETGDRSDLFFAIHDEDIAKFAVPRFQFGVRWIEDVYGNGGGYLYPARVAEYKTW